MEILLGSLSFSLYIAFALMNVEAYWEPDEKYKMELFCENNYKKTSKTLNKKSAILVLIKWKSCFISIFQNLLKVMYSHIDIRSYLCLKYFSYFPEGTPSK